MLFLTCYFFVGTHFAFFPQLKFVEIFFKHFFKIKKLKAYKLKFLRQNLILKITL